MVNAVTRLLSVPEHPPRAWFRDDSPDWVPGSKLRVVTTGPDEGRVFGLIAPPPGHTAYTPGKQGRNHRHYGRRPPDARLEPSSFTVFNRGVVEVTNDDGSIGTVAAGRLTLFGGHSQQAIQAVNLDEAVEWLHREGRWTDRADEVGIVGVASPVEDGPYTGAVMFRGAALPGMTVREATLVNSTSTSAEVWPSPAHGDRPVFAGAIVCEHTAWPYHEAPEALAASIDVCDGPFCLLVDSDTTPDQVDPIPEPDPVAPAEPVAAAACGGNCNCTCLKTVEGSGQPMEPIEVPLGETGVLEGDGSGEALAPVDGPISAEVSDAEVEALEAKFADLDKRLQAAETEIGELTVTVFAAPATAEENEEAGLRDRLAQLEELVVQLQSTIDRQANQPVTETQPSTVAPSARPLGLEPRAAVG